MDFLLGGIAQMGAGVFTNPLEVLKIRMQLQGELKARGHHVIYYKNIVHAAFVIAKNDGILALQKGLVPALCTQLFGGLRLGTYEAAHSRGLITNDKGQIILWKSVFFATLGSTVAASISTPMFLVKTQLQSRSNSSIAVGTQHEHRGTWPALKKIYKQHGMFGLYRGFDVTVLRMAVGSAFQLTSFTICKQWMTSRNLLKDSPIITSFVASMVGGVAIAAAMTPFDLVSTRIYNQGVDINGRGLLYNGVLDCIVKIFKTEGPLGFYKGIIPNYLRLGPYTVLSLVFWDKLKVFNKDFIDKYKDKDMFL